MGLRLLGPESGSRLDGRRAAWHLSIMMRSGTRLHNIWKGMRARCQTPSATSYAAYGGRGIKVCPEWQTFIGFLDWALASGYADDLEIDREDADGDYAPSNCRWTTGQVNRSRRLLDRGGRYLRALAGALTEESIAAASPASGPIKLWDGEGLYLAVLPTGRRVWRLKYRFAGRERLLTIGRYPEIAIAAARERSRIARAQIAKGRSPAREKAARKRDAP